MIVISGCPRSGTSMMTNTIGELLKGDGFSIIGQKFPQERRFTQSNRFDLKNKMPGESDHEFELRKYMVSRALENGNQKALNMREQLEAQKETMDEVKKLNQHGFYECRYTVNGCSWHLGIDKIVSGQKIAKIVSQGLPNTDPKYLEEGKIIFMVRNPREVAKSQEGLKHPKEIEKILKMDSDCKVHSPDMFISVSKAAAQWFLETGVKPLIIDYDEYCENPSDYLDKIIEYLGTGDKAAAETVLDLKQRRSKDAGVDSPKFRKADQIYDHLLNGEWQKILDIDLNPNIREIQCVRMEQRIPEEFCIGCKKGEGIKTYIKTAEQKGLDWTTLPCVYECGAGKEIEHISIEESVKNNHWNDTK